VTDASEAPGFPLLRLSLAFALSLLAWLGLALAVGVAERTLEDTRTRIVRSKELTGAITHLDEVLTMSARMNAASGDSRWEARYVQTEPQLEAALREAGALWRGSAGGTALAALEDANQALVEIERRSFHMVRAGQAPAARKVLDSRLYQAGKANYKAGVDDLARRVDQAFSAELEQSRRQRRLATILAGLATLASLVAWMGVVFRLSAWRRAMTGAVAMARESERLKEQFLNMVSHELRTPISIISSSVALMHTEPGRQALDEHLGKLERAARKLRNLVGDLLEASQLQAGTFVLRPGPCNLALVIDDAVDGLRHVAAANQQVFELDLAPDTDVMGDDRRLQQVVTNLLTNALAVTAPGGTATVRARRVGDRVRCEVVDTGPGVAPEERERLFQPFGRTDASRAKPGIGLGLYICRSLIEAHGGTIGVVGCAGPGSTFWFEVPALQARPGDEA
jgi:signal transduction histidine kinase